jgi:hypothetical protein
MQTLTVTRNARTPFSVTIDLAERFFKKPQHLAVGPLRWLRATVVQEAGQIRDVTDETMVHEALLVVWKARPRLPLPELHGLLTVRVNAPFTEVSIRCTYEPPFGAAGWLFDAFVGRAIAAATMRNLLDDVCAYAEREYRATHAAARDTTGILH